MLMNKLIRNSELTTSKKLRHFSYLIVAVRTDRCEVRSNLQHVTSSLLKVSVAVMTQTELETDS